MMEMRWHIGKPVQRFALTAGIVFVLALLTGPFPELGAVMVAGMRLVFGWLICLVKTLPTLRLDVVPVWYGTLGFVLACVALHLLLRSLRVQQGREESPRWKHSVGIAAGVSIIASLGVVAGEIVEHVTSFPGESWMESRNSERAYVVLNKARARYLVEQSKAAAEDDGHLLVQFHDVCRTTGDAASMMLFRTADPTAVKEFWIYLGGTKLESPGNVPVLAAPHPDKNGKRIVAFLDATVDECTEEEWQAAVERWRQAVKGSEDQKVTEAAR
jgi:hypothetical protein